MRIEVAGIPAPQGSKRHVGGGRMVEVSRAVGPWREAVRAETQHAVHPRYDMRGVPVYVQLHFQLPRPKSTPKKILFPVKRPDIDKLTRAVLDGLVAGGALADDSQVVTLAVYKRFVKDWESPGCVIDVEIEDEDEA